MLATALPRVNSMTSFGGGGPYPNAPSASALQLPSDPSHMPIFRSHSPKSHSPKQHSPKLILPPQSQQQQQQLQRPPMQHRLSRPIPEPSTALPTFTAGQSFASESHLQHAINWQTVTSRNLFEDPPTFQSLLAFILPSLPSPAVNQFIRRILNTPDHIKHLQKCWGILKRNDKEELKTFGFPEKVGDFRQDIYRLWTMVRLAWRIVQALKNARGGTRISEVGEWVLYVIDMNKKVAPEKFDPVPLQTFACALTYPHPSLSLNSQSKDTFTPLQRAERDKLALEFFELGFPLPSKATVFLPSTIYAKAHYARLLRRLGRNSEAEQIEISVKGWWTETGSGMMSKARFSDLVCAEGEDRMENPILKSLGGFFERRSENGSSNGEEFDSSSGRDSGIDVRPVQEPAATKEIKEVKEVKPLPKAPAESMDTLGLLPPRSPYGYNGSGSSDSLNSDHGKPRKFGGLGSKIRVLRKERSMT